MAWVTMMNNTPQIRFKGFADTWEQRKFSDIVNRVSAQSNADDLPKVEFEDIISGEGRLNKDISNKFDNRKGILFKNDNILYGKLRPYLKNWLFADFNGIALGDFWVFETVDSAPRFIYALIQTEKYQETANLSTGTKMPRSDWSIVSETDFLIPTDPAEQQQIGDFFRTLDTTINLHKRKLDNLRELKKAYLQQMFPQSGESVPRVRFAGFSEDWVERKLGEVVTLFGGNSFSSDDSVKSGARWLKIANVGIGCLKWDDESFLPVDYLEEHSSYCLESGDYVMALTRPILNHELKIAQLTISNVLLNQRVAKLYFSGDSCFCYQLLRKRSTVDKIENELAGTDPPNLSAGTLKNIIIYVPFNIEEQIAIGNFFRNLDEQITAQQVKLEGLKRLKAGYLQKMFV